MAEDARPLPSFFIDSLLQRSVVGHRPFSGGGGGGGALVGSSGGDGGSGCDIGNSNISSNVANSIVPDTVEVEKRRPELEIADDGLEEEEEEVLPMMNHGDAKPAINSTSAASATAATVAVVAADDEDDDEGKDLTGHHRGHHVGPGVAGMVGLVHGQSMSNSCFHEALCHEQLPSQAVGAGVSSAESNSCCSSHPGVDSLTYQQVEERRRGSLMEEDSPMNITIEPKRDDSCSADLAGGGADDGKKRPRTAFSADQVRALEQEFQRSKYLSVSKRTEMSRQLGLTEQQIKIWFQNRRTKWKRKYTNNLEILAQQHYLRMGLLPAYPLHSPGGVSKPASGQYGGMFGPGLGTMRPPFATPQPAVRLYPPFSAGPSMPRM